jgi:predicted Rossmann-fold nucleotide-binding protein
MFAIGADITDGMTRVLVCGGRDYNDHDALYAALDRLHAEHNFTVVIAGGARGADTLAAQWAEHRGIPVEVYMADWQKLGRKAGPIRNQRMLDEGAPDLVVAFAGGTGTAGMMALARNAGVPVITL